MAWYTARILICLITNSFIRGNFTPYYYVNNRPSEQDPHIHSRQIQPSNDACPTVPQLHAWAIPKRGTPRAAELCDILGGRCSSFVGTLSSTAVTESSTGTDYSISARTARSAAVKSSTSQLIQLIVQSENSPMAPALSVTGRSDINIPRFSLPSVVTSELILRFTSSGVKDSLSSAVSFEPFPPSTSNRVTESQSVSPSQLNLVPTINEVKVSTVVITELSTVSKEEIALPPTILLLTSTLTAFAATISRLVASSIKKIYPLNTVTTARPTRSTAEDVSEEETLRHGADKIAVVVASAGGGSSIVVIILALVRRYWKQYRGKKAIQEECQDDIPTHGNIGSSVLNMFNRPDDDAADCSFETQNLNQIATERENHAAAIGRVGAYRGVPLRDRRINHLAGARRLMGLEHLAPRPTGPGTSIMNLENVSSSSDRGFEDSTITPLHTAAPTNPSRLPLPQWLSTHRPRRDSATAWRPVPSSLPPLLIPQRLKPKKQRSLNIVTKPLETIEEDDYVPDSTSDSSEEEGQVPSSADRLLGEVIRSLVSERE